MQVSQTTYTYKFVELSEQKCTTYVIDCQNSKGITTKLESVTHECQVSSIWDLRATKYGNVGSDFLGFGCLLENVYGKRPLRDMFMVQWVWGSLFGTQCLVCLEPTRDIKQQGELAHCWLVASLLGCYRHTHTCRWVCTCACIHLHAPTHCMMHHCSF